MFLAHNNFVHFHCKKVYKSTFSFNFFIDSDLEWKPCIVFCNENGKLRGLEANPRITTLWQALHRWPVMDIIVGPAVILTGTSAFMSAL